MCGQPPLAIPPERLVPLAIEGLMESVSPNLPAVLSRWSSSADAFNVQLQVNKGTRSVLGCEKSVLGCEEIDAEFGDVCR